MKMLWNLIFSYFKEPLIQIFRTDAPYCYHKIIMRELAEVVKTSRSLLFFLGWRCMIDLCGKFGCHSFVQQCGMSTSQYSSRHLHIYLMYNPALSWGLFTSSQETSVHVISWCFPFDQKFWFECREIPVANRAAASRISRIGNSLVADT